MKIKKKHLNTFTWVLFITIILVAAVSAVTRVSDLGVFTPRLNITGDSTFIGDVTIRGKLLGASPLQLGHEGIEFLNESDDLHYFMYHALGDNPFINVSDDFKGGFIFESSHITNPTGMQVCFWDKENQNMMFCINDNDNRATTIRDSFQIVGNNKLADSNFNTCTGTNFIDCDSSATGADLFVEDDIEAQSIYANENINVTGNVTIENQIQIKGGSPADGRVLTSDANGLGRWILPAGGGWTDAGATVILTTIVDNVGIGESSPDTKLHVSDGGTSGANPFSNTIATFESPGAGYLSILTPNANERGIFFGEPASQTAGGIIYNDAATLDGLQFRTNGNNIRMSISSVGNVGIGVSSPDALTHIQANVSSGRSIQANSLFIIENNDDANMQIITPSSNTGAIYFSDVNSDVGGIEYNHVVNDMTFRTADEPRLTLKSDGDLGIGTASPNAKLEVVGVGGSSVGGFASGALHLRDPSTLEFRNAVITGHNSFNGNTQLWYLGSTSSSNDNVAFINRQAGEIHLHTNDLRVMTIDVEGNIDIDRGNLTLQDKITFRLGEIIDNLVNGWVRINGNLNVTGNISVDVVNDNTIFAQLSSSVDQIPINTTPTVITYDTQDDINGLTHSTSVNPGEITINTPGMYFVSPQPQVGKDQGATGVDFDMFLQVDRNGTFINELNSNIKLTIKDQDITDVIVSAFTISLNSGDKIRMMQKVSDSSVDMGLKNTNATAEVPRTPSIIFTMYRVGGQP